MGEISSDGESIFAERGANPKEAAVPPRNERQTAGAIFRYCVRFLRKICRWNRPVRWLRGSEAQRRLSKANFKLSAVIWREEDREGQRNERKKHATRRRPLRPG